MVAGTAKEHDVAVTFEGGDLTKVAEIERMFERIAESGPVDILVNNAGIQHVARIENFPVDRWDAVIALNLSAVFHATRLALPAMQKKNWAGSSTSPRPMGSWPRPRSRPTLPPSTRSSA